MTADFSESAGTELVVVSGETEDALIAEMERIMTFIDKVPDASLLDIAYTASLARGPHVISVIASSPHDLFARLGSARDRLARGTANRIKDKSGTYFFAEHLLGRDRGRLAFVYPGVTSFYPDMLRDVVMLYPECRSAFDELEEALVGESEFTPSNFIFPPASCYRHDADIFKSGAYAQALVSTFAASSGLTRVLESFGLAPDGVLGTAGGDLAAVIRSGAAGENSRPRRVEALADIYRIVNKAVLHEGLPKAAMITVFQRHEGEAAEALKLFPPGKVTLAIDISPRQQTYAVDPSVEAEVSHALAAAGLRSMKLALDVPFNTPLCEKIVPAIKRFAKDWMKYEPRCDVYSGATAGRLPPKPRAARNDTAERWARPVRLRETVLKMYEDGYRVFVEVGPRGLVSDAVESILAGRAFAAIALNSIHRRGVLQLQHGLAQLQALGAGMDLSGAYLRRGAALLDFGSVASRDLRKYTEQRLSRSFPRLTLLGSEASIPGAEYLAEPKGRGEKAAKRKEVLHAADRKRRQFESGAMCPLISSADTAEEVMGVSCTLTKTFLLGENPFLEDAAYGCSQLSYADESLRGLVMLSIPVAVEIMAEAATRLVANRVVIGVDDFNCRRQLQFQAGKLPLIIRAERVSSSDPSVAAVKVQLRTDAPDAGFTWPAMEATVLLSETLSDPAPVDVEDLYNPRTVHWSGREIYPAKLGYGRRLRCISSVESWGDGGLDYEVTVPRHDDSVTFTMHPIWEVDPLLLQVVVSGFTLWRSHERFAGAFSFPCRLRHLEVRGRVPPPGAALKCYLRLTAVRPRALLCDIVVSGGDGNVIMEVRGWEEITERVPEAYCAAMLQPGTTFVAKSLSPEALGNPDTAIASAYVTDVPYRLFELDEELLLKVMGHIVLNAHERADLFEMKGSSARRTEWLFGRIVAKEAVRRYLMVYHYARWSYADVEIWANESGKPMAVGRWLRSINAKIDVAIAHTAQFVVAVAAANARVGVDVESVARNLSEEFAAGVFTDEERELAAQAATPSQAVIRFWCAKEAVSKALGTGIRYSPKEMSVALYESDSGTITVRLGGAWAAAFPNLKGRDITVASKVMCDHALASCLIPMSLFDEYDGGEVDDGDRR